MSANTILSQQIDALETIRLLLSVNPKDIIATQEEARKQIQLTQAEEGKAAEARAFIAKHVALASNLKEREDALITEQSIHKAQVTQFHATSEIETIRLNNLATNLGKTQLQIEEADKRHIEDVKRLSTDRAELDKQYREIINTNNVMALANSQAKSANDIESQRLKDWEATLKAKAQKLREQAANF